MALELPGSFQGVFPFQWLRKAVDAGLVFSEKYRIPDRNLQPASIDLRLGERAYRLRCSFLPQDEDVETKLAEYAMEGLDLRDGAILERNRPYLIPLIEELALPPTVRAKTNPKSSIGRLDVFTRVITDRSHTFDEIRPGYRGKLYLEVVSRSFTIKVQTGLSMNQLRLLCGRTQVSDEEVVSLHPHDPLLFEGGRPVSPHTLAVADGLFLSVHLAGRAGSVVGYRAKKNSRLLDLSQDRRYPPADFWEEVRSERGGRVVLEPEEFYLLISSEAVRIPPRFAAEMVAYDPTAGELRTHYAGFFDPGFGHDPLGACHGTRAVLEVRAHDVPFMLEHGQRVCKLQFERMAEPPTVLYGEEIGSSYQRQEAMLSRYFLPGRPRRPGEERQAGSTSAR